MQIRKIIEDFSDYVKSQYDEQNYPIYINPTISDYKSMIKDLEKELIYPSDISKLKTIRFIIDIKNKKIYIFPAFLLHETAAKHLNKEYSNSELLYKNNIFDVGYLNKEYKIIPSQYLKKLFKMKKELNFFKKYFAKV